MQAVARRTGMDAAAHYRAVLGYRRPRNPAAIAGLGETGAAHDQDLLLPCLAAAAPKPFVRFAASVPSAPFPR